MMSGLGTTSKFQEEITYLYIVKIDGGGGEIVYLYTRISLFQLKKGNLSVKIDEWSQAFYLYNVPL